MLESLQNMNFDDQVVVNKLKTLYNSWLLVQKTLTKKQGSHNQNFEFSSRYDHS